MSKEVYIPATKTLFTAAVATNTSTGEEIVLTPEHKMVYFYCKDQYDFFKGRGAKFFASWEEIIIAIGLASYTPKLKRITKDLQTIGLIEIVGGKKSNHKVVRPVYSMKEWELSNERSKLFKSPEAVEERKEAKKQRLDDWANKQPRVEPKELPKEAPQVISPVKQAPVVEQDFPDYPEEDIYGGECPCGGVIGEGGWCTSSDCDQIPF